LPAEGIFVLEKIADLQCGAIRLWQYSRNAPTASPEIASCFGVTEKQAIEKRIRIKVGKFLSPQVGKASCFW